MSHHRLLILAALMPLAACATTPEELPLADFTVRPGVEVATVLGARPGEAIVLTDTEGTALLTVLADDIGQAHFSYVPDEHLVLDSSEGTRFPILEGGVLNPGSYRFVAEDRDPVEASEWFEVLAIEDVPDASFYAGQSIDGVRMSVLGDFAAGEDPQDGFQYLEMRDGTLLSAMVRFPDEGMYGPGPYPTVVEYSGYSPSRPSSSDSGTLIANALGYATVSVNMRGSGCSGGVFDIFNRAQHADGYDVVEIVARQPWALGGRVGMVGLSYPGITQLYVASTAPPSLAAIVPLSVIADAWEMQWPGGVFNSGFTQQWLDQRESDASIGGSSWVNRQIEDEGDTTCAENIQLSRQNVDFESFLSGLPSRPRDADDRDLRVLVPQIEAAVFLGGQWQDEQTGANFGAMLDQFDNAEALRLHLANGRHPDGFGPVAVYRWWEFLELFLAQRVPRMHPVLRTLGPDTFGSIFNVSAIPFEEDRFADFEDDEYEEALAWWRSEDPVRVLFEVGAGNDEPGAPVHRFEAGFSQWPPVEAEELRLFAGPAGALQEALPSGEGADVWRFDAEGGAEDFFTDRYRLLAPVWDTTWTTFAPGDRASYLTAPFVEDTVVAGPGLAHLWVRSEEVDDITVQVTLTEVRPDGQEVLVQSGWLRGAHRAIGMLEERRIWRSFDAADVAPTPVGEWFEMVVELPSFAHPIRAGSQLRATISAPGRNHGTWLFTPPADWASAPSFELGWGGAHATEFVLTTLPGIEVAPGLPPCPSLRGQPCRPYEE